MFVARVSNVRIDIDICLSTSYLLCICSKVGALYNSTWSYVESRRKLCGVRKNGDNVTMLSPHLRGPRLGGRLEILRIVLSIIM